MKVEVCYAGKMEQRLIAVSLPPASLVIDAILASGLLDAFPELSLAGNVGIFSKKVPLNQMLQEGDRVEIYRPLLASPNELRLLRAKKQL